MRQRQMSGGGRSKRQQKTYPIGRVCEAERCTTRLSIYNQDELCAHCDEVERRDLLDAERLERLLEAARG